MEIKIVKVTINKEMYRVLKVDHGIRKTEFLKEIEKNIVSRRPKYGQEVVVRQWRTYGDGVVPGERAKDEGQKEYSWSASGHLFKYLFTPEGTPTSRIYKV